MSAELKILLQLKVKASRRTTFHHPQSNGQLEHNDGIICKTLNFALKLHKLPIPCSTWVSSVPWWLCDLGSGLLKLHVVSRSRPRKWPYKRKSRLCLY